MSRIMIHIDGMNIGHGKKILYEKISFDIHAGDCIMLCGANGSGKTTLMKAIAGMQGNDCRVSMIPSRLPKVKGFTVKEFVKVSCFRQTDMSGKLTEQDEYNLEKALERLGIVHLKDRDISTLSDGEFQKACIAASLVQKAGVILLDEPTAFLDAENKTAVLQALSNLCKGEDSPAVIFSTHDLHEGMKACNRVIALGADGVFRLAGRDDIDKAVQSIFRQ
ncbi:MAG: ABC transporter ATP-binding protein [Bacteroidales bacterium]|nr:ABC transporter ATP-binding protein [Bacteroidales bacterium]MBR5862629.1 ABC transporter ATP-binding protein [Bacteroidales bacterium]